MKIYVSTNGCEEAQLSSMYVEQFFKENRQVIINDPAQADMLIFFACGLTAQTEKDSLLLIKKLKAVMKPAARLVVWGCLGKINPRSLAAVYDGPLIGPADTRFFERILEKTTFLFDEISANSLSSRETSGFCDRNYTDLPTRVLMLPRKGMDKIRFKLGGSYERNPYFIRVATGCTGECVYCSERAAWGKIRSRPIDMVISEFERGLKKGYKLFFLVAADLGAYGIDKGFRLPDLFRKMIKSNDERDYKIILNQINPFHLKELFCDLEETFSSGKIQLLCSPVQSGSNRILKLMRRPYTAEEWRDYMIKMNKQFPSIRLKTHFMVGFPTETPEDFKATLKLLDYPLFLDSMGIFKFSVRPTVYAARMLGQIPEEIKEARRKKLLRKYTYMYVLNLLLGRFRHQILSKP
ncbi:MAG: radical SAM protein [Candidatus Bathyarchaeia archaeon]